MQCLNCDEEIDAETKNDMLSEFIIHYHLHADFSGQRYEDHYCSMDCFMDMNEMERSDNEVYKTEIYTQQRHSTDHTQIFNDVDNATSFCEKIIEHENDLDNVDIEWLFDEDYNIMNGWYNGVIEARIRRKFLNHDVGTAMKRFHNND